MIAEVGHFTLILAFAMALLQGTLPLVGAYLRENGRADGGWMELASPAAWGQFLFVTFAFICLTVLFVTSDFSVSLVAFHSNSMMPLIYKISAVWGNHEGSMVLWVFILALCGLCVAFFGRNLPAVFRVRVLGIQGLIGSGFLFFILLTSNPFVRLSPVPPDGRDLNPLLQDPGLAFHPPFLYLGYVGFSIAFSFAIAALIEGRVDSTWARWVRPWTLAAWCSLTAGIVLGSWWAYYELGWGGFWFWDPVENASLIPWLVGTALLHSITVVERRDALKSWTILLSIVTFSLSLIGTFLVRSGVLTSVHAFATDPERGVFILCLLVIVVGGSLSLYFMRAPALKGGGLFAPISREGTLLLNNLLMTAAAGTVLLGTLYPLILDALGAGKVSVGSPYFNATFLPLMAPMVAAMAVGPLLAWKRSDLAGALVRLKFVFMLSFLAGLGAWYAVAGGPVLAVVAMFMAAWLFFGALAEFAGRIRLFHVPIFESLERAWNLPRASYGMTLAHAGLALTIVGITGASLWRVESIQFMGPGDEVTVSGYDITLDAVEETQGPNYSALRARLSVLRGGDEITTLLPEKRIYTVSTMPTTEAGIYTTLLGDLYAALGDSGAGPENDGKIGWTMRIWFNPLVVWIWIGSTVMVLGGLIALSDRRLRIGAPARRRRATPGKDTLAKADGARSRS